MAEPSKANVDKMWAYARKYAEKSGTLLHPDVSVTETVVMGLANVCYLLGPGLESSVRPADVDRYRKTAFAMGLWGSLAVPALFPLVQLAMLIAHSR